MAKEEENPNDDVQTNLSIVFRRIYREEICYVNRSKKKHSLLLSKVRFLGGGYRQKILTFIGPCIWNALLSGTCRPIASCNFFDVRFERSKMVAASNNHIGMRFNDSCIGIVPDSTHRQISAATTADGRIKICIAVVRLGRRTA